MDWKTLTVRLIEALRWPVAALVAVWLLREPIGRLIGAITPH